MRVVLFGLSLLSILNIVVAVQPVNVDSLLETTDDEDLIWLVKNRVRRSISDAINKVSNQGVPNEVISGLNRQRRDVGTNAGATGTGTGTNSGGAGGTGVNSSSNGGSDNLDIDYSGGSGEGSGEGADYDHTDVSHPVVT